ncbi:unnamed protein product [Adineta steineri]|uniref:Uncharacterized protein n=1 Tax=Adineta steineri TaxID=433720 RepID=A0A815NFC2_9BILA|nr:unnamed protein product [Adineta steineri]CAF1436961.1 unnamed protein product [Adineta steineri]
MIHSTNVSNSNDSTDKYSRISKSYHKRKKYRKFHHKYRLGNNLNTSSKRNDSDQSSLDTNQIDNKIPFDTSSMIRDHLYISIIGLLCFFPTGIFGLIRAMQAYEMKRPSSLVYWPKLAAIYGRHALRWAILSILIGTILWIIFIIYRLLREQHPLWNAYYQE